MGNGGVEAVRVERGIEGVENRAIGELVREESTGLR